VKSSPAAIVAWEMSYNPRDPAQDSNSVYQSEAFCRLP
jgi:hypothetical protein